MIRWIGIGSRWNNSRTPWPKKGVRGGTPKLTAYGIDDNGTLHTKRITKIEALLLKTQLYKRKKFVCLSCRRSSIFLVKHKDEIPPCPYCDSD